MAASVDPVKRCTPQHQNDLERHLPAFKFGKHTCTYPHNFAYRFNRRLNLHEVLASSVL